MKRLKRLKRKASVQRRFNEFIQKEHDEAVEKISQTVGILGIEGLIPEKLVFQPIKFPHLKNNGKETGDLILIWSPTEKEWEILVLEVLVGAHRYLGKYYRRLSWSAQHLRRIWRNWFEKLGIELPAGYTLWLRTAVVSWAGKAPWDKPYVFQKIRKLRSGFIPDKVKELNSGKLTETRSL